MTTYNFKRNSSVFIVSGGNRHKLDISDIDFNYNGEAIQINYSIINGSPESLYNIDLKAFTKDNSTIL